MKFIKMGSENFLMSYTKPLNTQMLEKSYKIENSIYVHV